MQQGVDLGTGVGFVQYSPSTFVLYDKTRAQYFKLSIGQIGLLSMAFRKVKLSEYKTVTVNVYEGKPYFHFKDIRRDKTISLTYDELKAVVKYGPRFKKYAHALLKEDEKKDKKKKKMHKSKKPKNKKPAYSSESEMTACDESSEEEEQTGAEDAAE